MNSHLTSVIPMIRFPFPFLYVKRRGMPQGTHQKHRDYCQLTGYCGQQLDPVAEGHLPCLRAIIATALLVKTTEKIIVASRLTIVVRHAVGALPNSYPMQCFSVIPSPPRKSFCKLLITQLFHFVITLTLLLFPPPSLMKFLMTA